jgi:hypothetical protein
MRDVFTLKASVPPPLIRGPGGVAGGLLGRISGWLAEVSDRSWAWLAAALMPPPLI